MQNDWWMRPALQKSEAVLLPALERRAYGEMRFGNRFLPANENPDVFRPAGESWESQPSTALSTYVRPRGSMAGRGVLRAAGVSLSPYAQRRSRACVRCWR